MRNNKWLLATVVGICLFIALYFAATLLYPGGSFVDKAAKGFSWKHNYWCELMAAHAQNGQINTASTIAITAMFVLAVSLAIFWIFVPRFFGFRTLGQKITTYSGVLSMGILFLLFTGSHDSVINIAGICGVIAITGLLIGLYKKRLYLHFGLGIICLVLCGLNNYIYYSEWMFYHLPVIQKITFLLFLLWFCLVDIYVFKKARTVRVD